MTHEIYDIGYQICYAYDHHCFGRRPSVLFKKKKKRNISAANVKKEIQFLMKPDYGY